MGVYNFLSKKYSISLNEILNIIHLYCKLMKILLVRKKIKKRKESLNADYIDT